jgi:hypothetical protein
MQLQKCAFVFSLIALTFGLNADAAPDENPFKKYFGEWTLKENKFQQVWDGKTIEMLNIPNHHTECKPINTEKSVFCVVNAGDLKGHILWTYDSDKKKVHHLSHFGSSRNGVGSGTLDNKGNLTTRVNFQGELEGSYRIYEYKWVAENEYSMISRQYDLKGKPTGNWYGGSFVRIANNTKTVLQ